MIMKERLFIQKAKESVTMEEFIRHRFAAAKCGRIEVQRTPIMTRIVIHTTTVGLVIGTGGEKIRETIEVLKEKFKMENPQIDVQKIDNPDLDPYIVAQNIAYAIESGTSYKRLGNFYLMKVMNAGAVGAEIIVSGKLAGERSRKERFVAGYLKKCGYPAQRDVLKGFTVANPRLGNIGVTVKIMPSYEPEIPVIEAVKEAAAKEEPKKTEAKEEPKKTEAKEEPKKTEAKEEPKKTEAKEEPKKEGNQEEPQTEGERSSPAVRKEEPKPEEAEKTVETAPQQKAEKQKEDDTDGNTENETN